MKKLFYIILIVIIAGFLASHEEDITPAGYMVLLGIFWLAGYIVKEYQKISKDIKDLNKYKDINDVINKYGDLLKSNVNGLIFSKGCVSAIK